MCKKMPPSSQKQRQRQTREPHAGMATLLLVAGAVAGFVWWRRRDAGTGSNAAAGSAFKFPKATPPARTPIEKRANNKKDKKRRAEENERRKEKRERKCVLRQRACSPFCLLVYVSTCHVCYMAGKTCCSRQPSALLRGRVALGTASTHSILLGQ